MQQPPYHAAKRRSSGSARIFQQSIQGIERGSPEERALLPGTQEKELPVQNGVENKDCERKNSSGFSGKPDKCPQEHLSGCSGEVQCSTMKKVPGNEGTSGSFQESGNKQLISPRNAQWLSSGSKSHGPDAQVLDSPSVSNPAGGQSSQGNPSPCSSMGRGTAKPRQQMHSARSDSSQNSSRPSAHLPSRGFVGRGRNWGHDQQSAGGDSRHSQRLGRGRPQVEPVRKPGMGSQGLPSGRQSSACPPVLQPTEGNSQQRKTRETASCSGLTSVNNESCGSLPNPVNGQQQQTASVFPRNVQPQGPNLAATKPGSQQTPSQTQLSLESKKINLNAAGKCSEMISARTNYSQMCRGHYRGKTAEKTGGPPGGMKANLDKEDSRQAEKPENEKLQSLSSSKQAQSAHAAGQSSVVTQKSHKKHRKKNRKSHHGYSLSSSLSNTSFERSDQEKGKLDQKRMDDVKCSSRSVENKLVEPAAAATSRNSPVKQSQSRGFPSLGSRRLSAGMEHRPCPPRFARMGRAWQDHNQHSRQGFRGPAMRQLPQRSAQSGQNTGPSKSSGSLGKVGSAYAGSGDGLDHRMTEGRQLSCTQTAETENRVGQNKSTSHSMNDNADSGDCRYPTFYIHNNVPAGVKNGGIAKTLEEHDSQEHAQSGKQGNEDMWVQSGELSEEVADPGKASGVPEQSSSNASAGVASLSILPEEDVMTSQDYRRYESLPGFTLKRYKTPSGSGESDQSSALQRDAVQGPSSLCTSKVTIADAETEESAAANGHMPENWEDEISQKLALQISPQVEAGVIGERGRNEDAGVADNLSDQREGTKNVSYSSVGQCRGGWGSGSPEACRESMSHNTVCDQSAGRGKLLEYVSRNRSNTQTESKAGFTCGRGMLHRSDAQDRCEVKKHGELCHLPSASTPSTYFLSADECGELPLQPESSCKVTGEMAKDSGGLVSSVGYTQSVAEFPGWKCDHEQLLPPESSQVDGTPATGVHFQHLSGNLAERENSDSNFTAKPVGMFRRATQLLHGGQSVSDIHLKYGQHDESQTVEHQFCDAHCRSDTEVPVAQSSEESCSTFRDEQPLHLHHSLVSVSAGRGRGRQLALQGGKGATSSSCHLLQTESFRQASENERRHWQGDGLGSPESNLSLIKEFPYSSRNALPCKSQSNPSCVDVSNTQLMREGNSTQLEKDKSRESPPEVSDHLCEWEHAPSQGVGAQTQVKDSPASYKTGKVSTSETDEQAHSSLYDVASWISGTAFPQRGASVAPPGTAASCTSSQKARRSSPSLPKFAQSYGEMSCHDEMVSAGFHSGQLKPDWRDKKTFQNYNSRTHVDYQEIEEGGSGEEYIDPSLAICSGSSNNSPLSFHRKHPFKQPRGFPLCGKMMESGNPNAWMNQQRTIGTPAMPNSPLNQREAIGKRQSMRGKTEGSLASEGTSRKHYDCMSTSGYSVDTEADMSLDTGSQEDLELNWRQACGSHSSYHPRAPLFPHQTLPPPHWDQSSRAECPFISWQSSGSPQLHQSSGSQPSQHPHHHNLHHHNPPKTKISPPPSLGQHPSTWSFALEGPQAEMEVNSLLWQVKACLQPERCGPMSINVVNFQVVPNESGLDILIRKKCVPWDTPQSEWWPRAPAQGVAPRPEWLHPGASPWRSSQSQAEWSHPRGPPPGRSLKSDLPMHGAAPGDGLLPALPLRQQQQQQYSEWLSAYGERCPPQRCQTGFFSELDMPDRPDTKPLNLNIPTYEKPFEEKEGSRDCFHQHGALAHPATDYTQKHSHVALPEGSGSSQLQPPTPQTPHKPTTCYCVARSATDVCSCTASFPSVGPETPQGARPGRKRPMSREMCEEGLPTQLRRRGPSQDWWSPPSDKEDCCLGPGTPWQQSHPGVAGEGASARADASRSCADPWFSASPVDSSSVYGTPPSAVASLPCSGGSSAWPASGKAPQPSESCSLGPRYRAPNLRRRQSFPVQNASQGGGDGLLNQPDLILNNSCSSAEPGEAEPETSIRWRNFCSDLQRRSRGYTVTFVDSHCHLDFIFSREPFQGSFQSFCQRNQDSMPANFEGCISIFCNPSSFNPKVGLWLRLAEERNVWLAFGCHPKQAGGFSLMVERNLAAMVRHPRVVAVGEMGLDYSRECFLRQAEQQKQVFRRQIEVAVAIGKPLIIHSRDAEDDCLAILIEMVPKHYKIHCHCFTASWEKACQWLEAFPNLCLGLTPLVTFRSALSTRQVARQIPLNRLLLETDSPYFVPQSAPRECMRLSHPGMAIFVAEEVAFLKSISVDEVLVACRKNTRDLFGI